MLTKFKISPWVGNDWVYILQCPMNWLWKYSGYSVQMLTKPGHHIWDADVRTLRWGAMDSHCMTKLNLASACTDFESWSRLWSNSRKTHSYPLNQTGNADQASVFLAILFLLFHTPDHITFKKKKKKKVANQLQWKLEKEITVLECFTVRTKLLPRTVRCALPLCLSALQSGRLLPLTYSQI